MMRATYPAALVLLVSGCMNITVVESGSVNDAELAKSSIQVAASPIPDYQRNSAWYTDAQARVSKMQTGGKAKNVVLFLGDGMGISTVTAARIREVRRAPAAPENGQLHLRGRHGSTLGSGGEWGARIVEGARSILPQPQWDVLLVISDFDEDRK